MIYLILTPWVTWILYVCIMRLKMVRDANQLTMAMKVFGYPALAVGLVLDLFVNVVFGSLVFAEIPKEYMLSARLWRLSNGDGWRAKVALSIRTALLDNIDPAGVHK